ncbi:hypothetical protein MKW98_007019 [Papaver atlanticum]|uniref:LysM domain-containing protein n=1 Tax=Papaver atlanticum TaxID=357466 RepID=A0AAD4XL51_9MAGN|nr:hypothetical protein MKW98_007019 [Papaver atlanticum]
MQIDRSRRNGNHHFCVSDYFIDRDSSFIGKDSYNNNLSMSSSSSPPSSLLLIPSTGGLNSNSGNGNANYLEHMVSKLDTLAGVAIKYGVEVADIKRMNGLVTDLQMFGLKSLQIPLPGRHPPSSSLSNDSPTHSDSSTDHSPSRRMVHEQILESLQSLKQKPDQPRISSAMSSLQGYYGLKSPNHKLAETEMSVYRTGRAHYLEDETQPKTPSSLHRKSRSLVNTILAENTNLDEDVPVGHPDKFVRRRQKADTDCNPRTPETLLKVDNTGGSGFSATAGKGLALRPKSTNRLAPTSDIDSSWLKPISVGFGDSPVVNGSAAVRKSSSTSNLHEQEAFVWPTSRRTSTTAASNRPIFDGLPKPATGRRNKAALD